MKKIIEILKNGRNVYKGFKKLKETKKTPDFAYTAMKKLFVQTNGRSNNLISSLIREKGYSNISHDGVLGVKDNMGLKKIVSVISRNGFHIFENKMPGEVVDRIVAYAKKTPCKYRKITEGGAKNFKIEFSDEVLFDEN